MNANKNIATKSASCHAPFVDALASTGTKFGQHLIAMRAFQAQYDAMLHLVECMISLPMPNTRSSAQTKTIADLRSLVIKERNELGLRQTEKR